MLWIASLRPSFWLFDDHHRRHHRPIWCLQRLTPTIVCLFQFITSHGRAPSTVAMGTGCHRLNCWTPEPDKWMWRVMRFASRVDLWIPPSNIYYWSAHRMPRCALFDKWYSMTRVSCYRLTDGTLSANEWNMYPACVAELSWDVVWSCEKKFQRVKVINAGCILWTNHKISKILH